MDDNSILCYKCGKLIITAEAIELNEVKVSNDVLLITYLQENK